MWDSQLQLFRNEVVLQTLLARVEEINAIVMNVANGGETDLTIADIELMVIETLTLQQASDQIMEQQNIRLAQLNHEIAESRKDNSFQ
jgi:uncharacterized protein YqfB (UPF0267 family)